MDKRTAKALIAQVGKIVKIEGYRAEVGRGLIGPHGELTIKVTLVPTDGAYESSIAADFNEYETYVSSDPAQRIAHGATFKDGTGRIHKVVGRTRTGKIETQSLDGKSWSWRRDAVLARIARCA